MTINLPDPHYVHLLLNHIPILGIPFALLLIIAALRTREEALLRAGFITIILCGLVAIPVFLTGEPAEDRIEEAHGTDKGVLHEHEEAGEVAIWLSLAAAICAALSMAWWKWRDDLPSVFSGTVLLTGAAAAGALIYTGSFGGKIRRPELRSESAASAPSDHKEDEHHEEKKKTEHHE